MNVFTVYAHMEPRSMNGALLEKSRNVLAEAGHRVRVSDLHAMNFDPVTRRSDFIDTAPGIPFDYYAEQKQAFRQGRLATNIAEEVEKLRWCDLLILQFPLYWFSVPAILKGWFDKVLVPGFAYGGGAWYERGGLKGKRAMLAITMAAYPQMMAPDGINGLLEVNLWPLQNRVLAFCGFDVLRPFVANAVPYTTYVERAAMIEAYGERLAGIAADAPIPSHRREEFDEQWRMKAEVSPRTVGHYFSSLPLDVLSTLRGDQKPA